ncbi:unnamed protein product [Trichobilharzia szidati]|nr:unnamed protein product [Trichobilharzia szidati]
MSLWEGYPHHAYTKLEAACRRYPNDPVIKLHVASLRVVEGPIILRLIKFSGCLQDALKLFDELREKDEFMLASLIAIAHINKKLPEIDQDVIKCCENKIRELRRHVSERSLYFAALVLFFFQRYEKAREYVERALKGNLLFKEALCLNGWIDLMGSDEGLHKKAVKYFEECTYDEEAMSVECLMGKIKYFQVCKSFSSAMDVINIVIVNFPNYVPALIEKMRLQLVFQDWEQASDTAMRCLTVDPTCIEALKLQLLSSLCYEGNYVEASKKLDELSKTLEKSEPRSSNQYSLIAKLVSITCGRDPTLLQKVQELCERAVEMTPRNHHYLINLGHIILLQGKPKEAVCHFRNALTLCETSIEGLEAIVKCQLVQNNLQEASTQLEFLNELQPTIGKSAEVNYMTAVLRSKQGLPISEILPPLNEAMELHLRKIQGVSLSPEYYERLNPDFLVQLVSEYLLHAPPQPPNIGSTFGVSNDAVCTNHQDDSVLMRCLRILEPLTSAAPGFQKGIYLKAYVHYMLGNTSVALANIKSCLEVNPSFLEGYILMAQIYLYMSNLKAAEQTLETGVGNNFEVRNHPLYQLVRARIMSRQGSAKIAVQILKQAIANLSNPQHRSQSMKSNNLGYFQNDLTQNDKLSLYIELADAHRNAGEQHEATKVLQDAYLAFAGTVEVARVTIAMANLALAQNDHETALNTLRQIQPDHPYYITARQNMADIYLYHRKEKKLFAACYRDLAEKLGTNEAYLLLGEAYMTIQEPEHAIEIYESILRKNPNDLRLASKIGHAFVKIHHYAKAVSYYETAVKTGQNGLRLELADLLINIKQFEKAKRLLNSMLTDEIIDSVSEVNDLEEIRRGLKLLIKLQIAEDDKLSERIDTLNRLKSVQARLLMRVQTSEVGDIVNEQKINMSDVLLQLAATYIEDIRLQCGDHYNANRFKDDHGKPAGDSSNTSSKTSLTQHLAMIISLCQDAIKQVSTVTGLKTAHSGHQINLNNSQFNEVEYSQIKKSAIHIEARALVQLIHLYLYTMDYVNCEQEILKLAQLQEEIEMSYLNTIAKQESSTDVNSSKNLCIPLKQQQQQQQKDKKVHNASLLSNWLPNIPLAAILMSKLMVAMGDFEAASKHLENVLNKNPLNYDALSSFIEILRRSGSLSRIPEFLDKAKLLDPQGENSSGLNYCRGLYHSFTGEATVALDHFNRCRKDPEYMEETIYRMVEICINPNNHLFGTETGSQLNGNTNINSNNSNTLNSGDESSRNSTIGYETAEHLLKEVKVVRNKKRFRFISTLLLLATKSKSKLESALETFAQMSQEDPDSVAPIYGAAACHMVLKQSQKAKNQLKRLAKVPWNFQDAEELEKSWLLLADIYIQNGRMELSQDLLKKCLQYNKSSAKASEYLGLIMEKEQNYYDAAKYYEQVWNNSNHQNPVIGYKLAYNYLKIRRFFEAVEVSLQVLSMYPNYPKIQKDILDKARLQLRA